jgi:glutaredoxin
MLKLFGHSDCQYCHRAKELLYNTSFEYCDLYTVYGQDNWKQVFEDYKDLIGSHKTIPLVFEINGDGSMTFIGGFHELKNYLEEEVILESSLCDR